MSFALTTEQIRQRQKTVTRRLGWKTARAGDVVQPVVKGQGLKKGEKVEPIGGPIRFLAVERQRLDTLLTCYEMYAKLDVSREGFPQMSPLQFVDMFCQHNGCDLMDLVTRIEFEYLEQS